MFLMNWQYRKLFCNPLVICGLAISMQNLVSHGNEQTRVTSEHWIGFDSSYANEVNSKTTAEWETRLSCIYGSWIYMQVWKYPKWWNAFRSLVFKECLDFTTTCSHCCLSTQTSEKLCRNALCDLYVNTPHHCIVINKAVALAFCKYGMGECIWFRWAWSALAFRLGVSHVIHISSTERKLIKLKEILDQC